MFPHAQQYPRLQKENASIAPSMAQDMVDFSTLSTFGINPLQTSPNLIGKFLPPNEFGVNARQNLVGGGVDALDFSNMVRKRGRKEQEEAEERMRKRGREQETAEAAAAAEEEEMAPSASIHSNAPTDNHQRVLPAPNSLPTAGAGTTPSRSLLQYFPDDPDSDLSFRIQKDLLELDLFLSAQMERLREEMELRRRRQWAGMAQAMDNALQRAVRAKDEEIASVERRNSALEERAGALAMEGQMWRALARTSEAAAAALRWDIQQAQQQAAAAGTRGDQLWVEGEVGDSVSCCEGLRREEEEEEAEDEWDGGSDGERRRCRVCRRADVSTLVLPCRHLCLCGECDAATTACPLCRTQKSASIKVHLL